MGPSEEARARLEDEIRALRARRRELLDELEQQRDWAGDRGDSSQELQGGDELVAIDDRIAELEWRLAGGTAKTSGLPPGTEVKLRMEHGTVQTWRVVAIPEEIAPGAEDTSLTSDSPLGMALVNSRPGQTVTYSTPNGEAEVEVIEIRLPGIG
ncbi:hypothetical protein GCM10011581_17880 [Saccharopolyspora subtropica]|uniref:GreA/GreB family elongation factor n=1 Tax=Saccharopolyspora thermophila TaxID=89367 RepID=A0A917JQ41_9PSEU|nr:GreA/GreB family elongation factor [Saccharopolyspora subtropica]GGI80933.1 hypothetical protein GCM10011581_17880 [Saccharopolyspora subtropica]